MEPTKIFDVFFSHENPAIYAIIFVLILIVVVLQIKHKYIVPLHTENKRLKARIKKLRANK